jgi:hypothetical protein
MTEHIDGNNHLDLMDDEEQLESKALFVNRSHIRANRLNDAEVEEARSRRVKEVQMWSILREIFSYLCFLWIVYTLSYSNRDNNAFVQVNHLRNYFLNIGHNRYDYTKVRILFFLKTFSKKFDIDRLYQLMNIGIG